MNGPFFTVCILTYNYGKYIEQAIDSVINQSFRHWEVIVFDDASSDNTEELVSAYLHDGRVSYVRHRKNIGQGANWAQALKSGKGNVVCTLHADDFWEKDILQVAYDAFISDDRLELFFVNWKVVKSLTKGPVEDRCSTGKIAFADEMKKYTILPSATFIRRNLILKCDLPSERFKLAVDTNYFFRLLLKADIVVSCKKILLNYRIHKQSASSLAINRGYYFKEIHENLLMLKEEAKLYSLDKFVDFSISMNKLDSADYNLKTKKFGAALEDMNRSFLRKSLNIPFLKRIFILSSKYVFFFITRYIK